MEVCDIDVYFICPKCDAYVKAGAFSCYATYDGCECSFVCCRCGEEYTY